MVFQQPHDEHFSIANSTVNYKSLFIKIYKTKTNRTHSDANQKQKNKLTFLLSKATDNLRET